MSSRLLRWLCGIAQCSRGLDLACTVLFVTVFVIVFFLGVYMIHACSEQANFACFFYF